ncbi:putative tubulin--tyrosine ligase pby1 [Marasmius crinis-equi]|uniref:Tubulin--tyrosine ligase pby1 n=1 Tax=Marasmius crinis-equi TaxID=585013 RepID=A0ABR3FYE0_9AGAR
MSVAKVIWPSAPLTDSLIRNALSQVLPDVQITDSNPASNSRHVQWSSYDEIDHELVNLQRESVLSSSYTFRKCLIRKHFLSRCISSYLTKKPDSLLKHAWPRTYEIEISFVDELDEIFADELWELGQELEASQTWWILKPGMADRGNGIRLFKDRASLEGIFQEFEDEDDDDDDDPGQDGETEGQDSTAVVTSQLRHFVIQQYLSNPLLFDPLEVPVNGSTKPSPEELQDVAYQFHLRAYCVASGALTLYLYDRILALFSSKPYQHPDLHQNEIDLACHLTNTSLQAHRGEEGVRLMNELVGCRVLSHSGETRRTFAEEDVANITSQMLHVLRETFEAALRDPINFQPLPNAFELFGVDFLVTHSANDPERWQVQLLEINAEPAIELTGPRLKWILEDLFIAMAEVCVKPFTDAIRKESDDWPDGEARHHLIKCLGRKVRS